MVVSKVAAQRAGHQELIDQNQVAITLMKTERVREGGGSRQQESIVGIVTGRVYLEATGRAGASEAESTATVSHDEERFGLLLPEKMKAADGVTEIATAIASKRDDVVFWFLHPTYGRMNIITATERRNYGEVWGWAATLERHK